MPVQPDGETVQEVAFVVVQDMVADEPDVIDIAEVELLARMSAVGVGVGGGGGGVTPDTKPVGGLGKVCVTEMRPMSI